MSVRLEALFHAMHFDVPAYRLQSHMQLIVCLFIREKQQPKSTTKLTCNSNSQTLQMSFFITVYHPANTRTGCSPSFLGRRLRPSKDSFITRCLWRYLVFNEGQTAHYPLGARLSFKYIKHVRSLMHVTHCRESISTLQKLLFDTFKFEF